jgi:hypothetical protein
MAGAERKAFLLRVDPALWEALERLAAAELRSVNAEVEFLLREALAARGIRPRRAATDPARGAGAPPRRSRD